MIEITEYWNGKTEKTYYVNADFDDIKKRKKKNLRFEIHDDYIHENMGINLGVEQHRIIRRWTNERYTDSQE